MTPEDLQSRPSGPLAGIKVVELASWMFVPSAGTVLVDWGADVVKVEHPVTGDPQRGLVTSGLLPGGCGTDLQYPRETACAMVRI
jgi:crotonobetainyl-CoA:carnitine CoA-transferase CaiB-like acyl-CoA transferase